MTNMQIMQIILDSENVEKTISTMEQSFLASQVCQTQASYLPERLRKLFAKTAWGSLVAKIGDVGANQDVWTNREAFADKYNLAKLVPFSRIPKYVQAMYHNRWGYCNFARRPEVYLTSCENYYVVAVCSLRGQPPSQWTQIPSIYKVDQNCRHDCRGEDRTHVLVVGRVRRVQ